MEWKYRGSVILPFPNKTARWAYGSLVKLNGSAYIVPDDAEVDETGDRLEGFIEVDPASVGLYLGEVESGPLYEKDIVDMPFTWYDREGMHREMSDEGFFRGEVVLYPSCGIRIKKPYIHSIENGISKHGTHLGVSRYITKVIGNTTDNSDLLEQS